MEEDLKLNYAEDVVMLTTFGVHKGHAGMRYLAKLLQEQLPEMTFTYENFLVEGDVGFLEWTADAEHTFVKDGADSYVVREGLIVAQTIHYTVRDKNKTEAKSYHSKETLEGYVVDIACLRTIPSARIGEAAKEHSTACALMGHCVESGYGLVDENGKVTLLDPKATRHVVESLMKTSREKGAWLRVRREGEGDKMEQCLFPR